MKLFHLAINAIRCRLLGRFRRFILSQRQESFSVSVPVDCHWKACLGTLSDFYSFHDEKCPDVIGVDGSRREWRISHYFNNYPVHFHDDKGLSYDLKVDDGGMEFSAGDDAEHWLYLVSKEKLPTEYAIEFEYKPKTVFNEQLQFCFAADSLAERHRFVLNFNEKVYYQIVTHGFWSQHYIEVPCSLMINEWSCIRLEVVGNVFSFFVKGKLVLSVKDSMLNPKPARNFLIFWNGKTRERSPQRLAASIRGFKWFKTSK
jgi:hypothetical protein